MNSQEGLNFSFSNYSFGRQSVEESTAISEAGLYFVILLEAGGRKPKKPKFNAKVANFAFNRLHNRAPS